MTALRDSITKNLAFITVLTYGGNEYIGIIINQNQYVTTFYDINKLKTHDERSKLIEIGDIWWWESNRQFPISIFCKDQLVPFKYAIKTFNTKDTKIILGPSVNLLELSAKRIKRKSITLLRNPK